MVFKTEMVNADCARKFQYHIHWPILNIGYIILAECGWQIPVTKSCIGGRISYISTNITALTGQHLCLLVTEYQTTLDNRVLIPLYLI